LSWKLLVEHGPQLVDPGSHCGEAGAESDERLFFSGLQVLDKAGFRNTLPGVQGACRKQGSEKDAGEFFSCEVQ
jgi:hypothetical protein